jgi:signal transduction histidine kinase
MIRPFLLLRKSVVFKITFVIILMALSFAMINLYLIDRQFQQVSSSKKSDQISLAKITATNLSDMTYHTDFSRMMDVLNNLKEGRGEHQLQYGLVMDNKGYAYAHTDDHFLGTYLKDSRTEYLLRHFGRFEQEKILIQEYKGLPNQMQIREIAVPISTGGNFYIHILRLGFSLKSIEDLKKQMWAQTISVGLISTLVVIFLYGYLRKSVLRPISELTRNAKDIQEDKADRIVPIQTGDEIEDLSKAFGSMLENLRQKQDLLFQSHRELAEAKLLSAVGEGAFSIAHRIGNLLNPVETWIKNIEVQHDVKDNLRKVYQQLALAKDYILRAKNIDPGLPRFEPYSVSYLMDLSLERNPPPAGVKVIKKYSPVRQIKVDPSQMEDVFTNIIVNAYQAMEGRGGVLSVEIAERMEHIFISVSDQGPGIKTPIHSIYDLYHTTKKDGTGFGLFRAQRVIKAHQGTIYAENRPDQGATFTIKLPVSSPGEAGGDLLSGGQG